MDNRDSQRKPSEINIVNNDIFIHLKNIRYEYVGTAIVDKSLINLIKNKRWSLNSDGYVVSRVDGELKYLHHLVVNFEGSKDNLYVVDHIDRNKLNNRRSNLRIIEKHKNHVNHNGYKNNKSGFTGVTFDKERNKWKVLIHINKKQKLIGRFDDINDAITARLNAELKHYGEDFAPQRDLFAEYGIGDGK